MFLFSPLLSIVYILSLIAVVLYLLRNAREISIIDVFWAILPVANTMWIISKLIDYSPVNVKFTNPIYDMFHKE